MQLGFALIEASSTVRTFAVFEQDASRFSSATIWLSISKGDGFGFVVVAVGGRRGASSSLKKLSSDKETLGGVGIVVNVDIPPSIPLNLVLSFNKSMVFEIDDDGGFGGGPPPVPRCNNLCSLNTRFAVVVRFFHLVLQLAASRTEYPTALTEAAISFHASFFVLFVTLLLNADVRDSRCLEKPSLRTRSSSIEKFVDLWREPSTSEDNLSPPLGKDMVSRKRTPKWPQMEQRECL